MDIAVWNSIFVAVIYILYFAVILTTIFVVILDNTDNYLCRDS